MRLIGLTGGIACGKSTVSQMLQEHGAIIIDCDEIARDVVVPGTDAYNRIVDYFGSEVVQADRTLDRAKLGEMVFGSPMKRKALNSITSQPIFWAVIRRIFHEMFIARSDVVILDAPLLFETKVFCYLIKFSVVVYVKPQIQLQRLMARNGYSSPEAQQRINSQMPLDDKVRQARYVIDNSGEKDELRCQVDTLYAKFRESWPTGTHTLIFCFTSLAVIVGIRPLLTTIFAPRV